MENHANNINKFGLLNSLITIINEGKENSSDVLVSKYLLQNYKNLHNLNIYDVAEHCYVDRATIRRIARKLGFENFKDLKNQLSDFSDFPFYRTGIGEDTLGNTVAMQLANMTIECDNFFDTNRLDTIVGEIHEASQIVFLTFDVYSRQSSEFQKAMLLSGKMVRVISNKYDDNKVLSNISSNDILIVISISGFFVSQVTSLIEDSSAKKILLTTVREKKYENIFDEIWYLSEVPQIEKRSVYTMFATQYCLERIFEFYIKKYK